jgi:hypothetical protein
MTMMPHASDRYCLPVLRNPDNTGFPTTLRASNVIAYIGHL